MKGILVYFSLNGHTRYVAKEIAQRLGLETLELETVKDYPKGKFAQFFFCGRQTLLGQTPNLKDYDFKGANYDLVVLGTPVWASSYAAPLETFFKENHLNTKQVAVYACSSGGNAEKCFSKVEAKVGELVATLSLIDPTEQGYAKDASKIEAFCQTIKERLNK